MITPTPHFLAQRGNSPVLQSAVPKGDAATGPERAGAQEGFWGKDGFSFGDLLDIINPLQHIPVISTLYRSATGDEISPAARLAGDTLIGGPVGFVVGMANAITAQETGKDVGETVLASLASPKPAAVPAAETQVAASALAGNNSPRADERSPEQAGKEIQLAMATPGELKGKPMETLPIERLRGPQSEPGIKSIERLRDLKALTSDEALSESENTGARLAENSAHALPVKGAPHFMPLPMRAASTMPLPGRAQAMPIPGRTQSPLEPLPGIGAVGAGDEPVFPGDDGRQLIDWYVGEHASLSGKMQKLQAHYENSKMLDLSQQAALDLKT